MSEAQLFQYLKERYIPDLVESRRQFSRWDCYSPQTRYRVELKCRRKHYPDLVIEKSKYEALINKCTPHNDIPVYICSTPEGVWAFRLDNIPTPNWITKRMPETTDFKRRQFIDKEVGMLPLNQGTKI